MPAPEGMGAGRRTETPGPGRRQQTRVMLRRVAERPIACQERDLPGTYPIRGPSRSASAELAPPDARYRLRARLDDDDGDVVVTAAVVRERDEATGGEVERALLDDAQDLRVVDEVREPVAADDERVARIELEPHEIDHHLLLEADRARDDVLEPAVLRLVGADRPGLELLVDERVVLGDLVDAPLPQEVAAAVADVRDERGRGVHEDRRDRRAHPGELRLALRGPVDDGAGLLDRLPQKVRHPRVVGAARAEALRLVLARVRDGVPDGLDREPRGGAATRVAAHAVGDDEEAARGVDEERILVVVAALPDVGDAACVDAERGGPQARAAYPRDPGGSTR